MHAIAREHASTHVTSFVTVIVWDIGMKKKKDQKQQTEYLIISL